MTTPIDSFVDTSAEILDSVETSASNAAEGTTYADPAVLDSEALAVTAPFVGQWNTLVSQTNWEKGKIIAQWRAALVDSGATPTSYSDETWSRQVGAVTSQHVGRLRRVFERFGGTQQSYPGLYWSHFLAAIDWDDAELWLEGAMRSNWSISEMRKTRWESAGGDPKHAPKDEELITSEVDDDFNSLVAEPEDETDREASDRIESSGPLAEDPDFGDADQSYSDADDDGDAPFETESADASAVDTSNPFTSLPDLPLDIEEALESFKLCIVRHRSSQWADFSQKQMLDVIEALKTFALR